MTMLFFCSLECVACLVMCFISFRVSSSSVSMDSIPMGLCSNAVFSVVVKGSVLSLGITQHVGFTKAYPKWPLHFMCLYAFGSLYCEYPRHYSL